MNKKSLIIASISALAVLIIAYVVGGLYYTSRFLPNTFVQETEISGETVAEASRQINERLEGRTVAVVENGQTLKEITPKELKISFDSPDYFKKVQEQQNHWAWPVAFFNEKQVDAKNISLKFDEAAVSTLLEEVKESDQERFAPVNAQVKNKEGTFYVEEEVPGTEINKEKFEEELTNVMISQADTLAVENTYLLATLTKDSEELKERIATLQNAADTTITYTLAGQEIQVPKEQIAQWLSVDETGQVVVDRDAARGYLDGLHDQYATFGKPRSFKSTNRGTVEVPAGEYGWSVAVEEESGNLVDYILAGENVTVTPAILGSGYHEDGTDIGNTYIEIDLASQNMYYYQNGERVFETPIVSGHSQTPTPVGVFMAWNKVEDTDLIGYNPRRGNDYAQPVDYWIPIDWDGVGIHDAAWQASFSPEQWKTNGSNGCINTPPGAMGQLYALIDIGTPVVIF
ncbi:L,D-transpeptidase 1 [Jeotgalibaca dankookensis]|uniref:L,D-transpeptidase 1 n=1 Tax=Jeotgalibaca dankookensis TaxID=708126 RepID=A0A1S6IR88_9LACT|nr:L,D-transpeptidase family protein [Jeotgalibaca dankookensis]AQS54039.1 L,D-transpeptidase 1 [Jeotgalibaca dankookensis]